MTTALSAVADRYVEAVNRQDATAYVDLFAEDAVVDDAGRTFRGRAAISAWSKSDIFGVQVSFEVLETELRDGETIVITKVDGNFDRTGLPDPVVISHTIRTDGEKIVALTCRLSS